MRCRKIWHLAREEYATVRAVELSQSACIVEGWCSGTPKRSVEPRAMCLPNETALSCGRFRLAHTLMPDTTAALGEANKAAMHHIPVSNPPASTSELCGYCLGRSKNSCTPSAKTRSTRLIISRPAANSDERVSTILVSTSSCSARLRDPSSTTTMPP